MLKASLGLVTDTTIAWNNRKMDGQKDSQYHGIKGRYNNSIRHTTWKSRNGSTNNA